jgi:hypothetical protein
MKIIKNLRIFTIGIFLLIDVSFSSETALTFMPYFASTYYSTGSILHSEKDGSSNLTHFQLGAKKSDGSFTISGFFQFTSAQNLDFNSTYINPDLNIEMNRGYIESQDTWFESSNLKIAYQTNTFSASFGKYNQSWGHGNSSLILSNNLPSYPQAGFSWKMSKTLTLEYLIGSLSSQIVDSSSTDLYNNVGSRNTFYSRSIAAHRFIWKPSPSLIFNAIETVIFGDRTIDVHYLLPFIPFWSMQHYTGDIDNVQMCGEIIWKMKENWDIYGSLFVDEWRPEWTFDDNNRNWFGYQLGMVGNSVLKEKDELRAEYTWTDHRIYRHRFPINDSYSYNYSLGFWAGPHAEELYFSYNTQFNGIDVSSSFTHLKRGELTEEMLLRQYDDTEAIVYDRFSGNTESRNVASIKGTKGIFNNRVFIRVGCDWIDWTNPGFNPYEPNRISGKDFSKFSLNIGITAKTTFSLN